MRLRKSIATLWLDFFADDLNQLPPWVEQIVKRDQELQTSLQERIQFEHHLRQDREEWCDCWTTEQGQHTTPEVPTPGTQQCPVEQGSKQPPFMGPTIGTSKRLPLIWQTTGVLAASLLGFIMIGLWWNRPSSDAEVAKLSIETQDSHADSNPSSNPKSQDALDYDPTPDSMNGKLLVSNSELLPILATAAATQEVATKITSSSWLLATRLGELPERLGVQRLLLASEDGMRSAVRRLTNSGTGKLSELELGYPELEPPSENSNTPPEA